jgi:probable F420-dependent oxidoreductase
MGGV